VDEDQVTKGDARYVLRRRLQEDTPNHFANSDLDRLMVLGMQEIQKRVLIVQPESFKAEDRADLVAGQDFYEWPAGVFAVKKLATGNPTDGYSRLSPISLLEAEGGAPGFVPWDQKYFQLSPKPDASVVNGLQCIGVPTLTVYDDSEVLPLPISLHMAIVLAAEVFALGDLGEASTRAKEELGPMIESIPGFFLLSEGPKYFAPDTGRGY